MRTRKIIAKEGLILLGIVALGLLIYFFARHLNSVFLIQHQGYKFKVINNMKYSMKCFLNGGILLFTVSYIFFQG